jgi:cytochrome c biogenesis protein
VAPADQHAHRAAAAVPGSRSPPCRAPSCRSAVCRPPGVQQYFVDHPSLAPVLDRLSLFDVYAAPWFAAIYLLLFVSLIGCLGPRIRLHARALRTPPPAVPRTLSRLPVHDPWEGGRRGRGGGGVGAAGAEEGALARRAASRRRRAGQAAFRREGLPARDRQPAASTSRSWLLVGIAPRRPLRLPGLGAAKEGDGFANAVFNYDDIRPGRRFGDEDLEPFYFSAGGLPGAPTTTRAGTHLRGRPHLRGRRGARRRPGLLRDPGQPPADRRRRAVYLSGHGYAPHVVVPRRGRGGGARPERAVPAAGADFLSACVIKVPDATGEQLAFEGVFTRRPSRSRRPAGSPRSSPLPRTLR